MIIEKFNLEKIYDSSLYSFSVSMRGDSHNIFNAKNAKTNRNQPNRQNLCVVTICYYWRAWTTLE
jgi:hypothetical protein